MNAIFAAKEAGFSYINIDIMTGLEGQTPKSWEYTLQSIQNLIDEHYIDSVFIYPFHVDPEARPIEIDHVYQHFSMPF